MLRITVHEDDGQCRLELAGRLGGPWVTETESVWRAAPYSRKEMEIDLRQVTAVDDAGRGLLSAMHQAGARLVAEGVAMAALVQEITGEITGKQLFNSSTGRQLRRKKLPRGPTFPDQESSK
jgi:hypothetical protein